MKKLFVLALVLSAFFIRGQAQNSNNICVFNAIENYANEGGASELERGMKCSDEAAENPAAASDKKTWFYRGKLYTLVFRDTVENKKVGTAAFEAINAFKKLDELNDPKFKDWDEVFKYLIPLGTSVFNHGVDSYKDKNYAQAFKFFYSIIDLNAIFKDRKQTPNIDLATAMKNAAVSAENAGDYPDAIKAYELWLAAEPTANAYYNYSLILKKSGDTIKSGKTVDEGLAKFPNDANLLGLKINKFIDAGDFPGALSYLNKLLAVTPDNDRALVAKGRAFASMNQEDSAMFYYNKAHDVNPKNPDALTQIGDYYITKGNLLGEDMNKLGNTPDDIKKYNELKAKRKQIYLQAKPYYEQAQKIVPDDGTIKRILGKLEALTAD